jgi:hypothetical protein
MVGFEDMKKRKMKLLERKDKAVHIVYSQRLVAQSKDGDKKFEK